MDAGPIPQLAERLVAAAGEDAGELARRGHDAFRQLWDRAAVQMKT